MEAVFTRYRKYLSIKENKILIEKINNMELKIIFLVDKLTIGGAEKITFEIARNLSFYYKRKVEILALNNSENNLETNNFDIIYPVKSLNKFFYFWKYPELFRIISSYNPDIIHSSMEMGDWLAGIYKFFHPKKVVLSTIHTYQQNRQHKIKLKHKLQFLMQSILYNRFNKIVCVSNDLKNYMKTKFGVRNELLMTIYNGVENPGDYPIYKKNKKFKGDLVFIGGLRTVKNIDMLINVLKNLPDYYSLTIIGEGPQKRKLVELAEDRKLGNRVRFLGMIPNAYNKIINYDILIIPSLHETFSLTALEALIVGIPVLLTNNGGGKELFENRLDDLLFDSMDINELKNKILYVEDNYRQIISRIYNEKNFYLRFSTKNMVQKYKELYELYFKKKLTSN